MPGCGTTTECQQAYLQGATLIKIFPGAVLGPAFVSATLAPLPHLKLMPTGGVSLKTAADLIKAGSFALGVGSDLIDHKAMEEEDWNTLATAVSARTREYVAVVREARAALAG